MRKLVTICLLLLPIACATPGEWVEGQDTTVVAFDGEHVYYAAGDDRRTLDTTVVFPEEGLYERITLRLGVRCPSGGCDYWDRIGTLSIVTEDDEQIEVWRFITPYRIGADWQLDVTDLRPALVGTVTLRVYISTGVGPGSPYGEGWLFDAAFDLEGGIPEKIPEAVHPLWMTTVWVGHPDEPPEDYAPVRSVEFGPNTTSGRIRAFITGHGQGNTGNCAEFCRMDHTITLTGDRAWGFQKEIWRDDCATTAEPGQFGTYTYSRAGWCPGAPAYEWTENLGDAASPDNAVSVLYGIGGYENTCRPDAPEAPNCMGCTLGASCDYNGSNHTKPRYIMSASLITYR